MTHQFHNHHHHHQQHVENQNDENERSHNDNEHLLPDGTSSNWFETDRRGSTQSEDGSIHFTTNHRRSDNVRILPLHEEAHHQRKEKELLQQKLRFYFMSPIDKWRIKRRVPLKLMFQLAKILFVTIQILYFGNEMSDYLKYEDNTRTAFRETLLSGWDASREVFAYPPSTGPYAVYTIDSFYSNINYAIQKYSNISQQSVGNFAYDFNRLTTSNDSSLKFPRILFEKQFYKRRIIDAEKYIFNFDDQVLVQNIAIENLYPSGDERWVNEFDIAAYFKSRSFEIDFDSLILLKMKFPLRTVYFNSDSDYGKNTIRCYSLNITFEYDNSEHDGLIEIKLGTERRVHQCKNQSNITEASREAQTLNEQILIYREHHFVWPHILNWFVVIFCSLSAMLCVRSIYRGQLLRHECSIFFNKHYHQPLEVEESMEFIDVSILTIFLNDILIICGTFLKIQLESTEIIDSDIYTRCSLLLGIGNLLIWIGLLRYFSYFQSYNILIITVRKSIPKCLRFLVCVFMLYGGFCFCGWIVLGPHHLKFRSLSSTAECLFSLMNGDDMFATFFSADVKPSSFIWWFSRLYLYIFISFSIYVIVSLFIAIILDSYESIRDFYGKRDEEIRTRLQKFADEVPTESIDGRSFTNNSIVDHIYRFIFFRT